MRLRFAVALLVWRVLRSFFNPPADWPVFPAWSATRPASLVPNAKV